MKRERVKGAMVPIDGDYVRVALERRFPGESEPQLAKRLGFSQQTLNAILHRGRGTCHAPLREKIVKLLAPVPVEWIEGRPRDHVAFVPAWWQMLGYGTRAISTVVDSNADARAMLPTRDGGALPHVPPLRDFLVYEVAGKIEAAWRRDRNADVSGATAASSELARGWTSPHGGQRLGISEGVLRVAIDNLFAVNAGRSAFLSPIVTGTSMTLASPAEGDAYARSMADALTALLSPWFAGKALVSYDMLVALLRRAINPLTGEPAVWDEAAKDAPQPKARAKRKREAGVLRSQAPRRAATTGSRSRGRPSRRS